MTVLTAAEVLRQARALIIERGWGPFDDTHGISVYYAVTLATLGHALGDGGPLESEAAWSVAVHGPCAYVEDIVRERGYTGIPHFEADDERTGAQVVAVLDLAIRTAESACHEPMARAA